MTFSWSLIPRVYDAAASTEVWRTTGAAWTYVWHRDRRRTRFIVSVAIQGACLAVMPFTDGTLLVAAALTLLAIGWPVMWHAIIGAEKT